MTDAVVSLDAGGVLILPRPDFVSEALGREIPPELARRCHYTGVAAWDAEPREDVDPWPLYFGAYARTAGVEDAAVPGAIEVLWDAFRRDGSWTQPIPEAIDAMRRLGEAGVTMVVVSNSQGHVDELLRRAGVCQAGPGPLCEVVAVIDSGVVGIEKPDPAIFDHAVEATGAPIERVIHIGDTYRADVVGAQRAGARPVHLDPFGWCPVDDEHHHVASLGQLADELLGA